MKLFVKDVGLSTRRSGAQTPRVTRVGGGFFDGPTSEGLPASVLPSSVRQKLDKGQEVAASELVPSPSVKRY